MLCYTYRHSHRVPHIHHNIHTQNFHLYCCKFCSQRGNSCEGLPHIHQRLKQTTYRYEINSKMCELLARPTNTGCSICFESFTKARASTEEWANSVHTVIFTATIAHDTLIDVCDVKIRAVHLKFKLKGMNCTTFALKSISQKPFVTETMEWPNGVNTGCTDMTWRVGTFIAICQEWLNHHIDFCINISRDQHYLDTQHQRLLHVCKSVQTVDFHNSKDHRFPPCHSSDDP